MESPLRFAIPTPIRHATPWSVLNTAETSLMRMIYDSLAAPSAHQAVPCMAGLEVVGPTATLLTPTADVRYSDGEPVPITAWQATLAHLVSSIAAGASCRSSGDRGLLVEGLDRSTVLDVIRCASAVPFRASVEEKAILGGHPDTAGRYGVRAASQSMVGLRRNALHRDPAQIDGVELVLITEPEQLREAFAANEIDIMVVADDERDLWDGTDARCREGQIMSAPTNSVSMLSVRPNGALADGRLRARIADGIPRQAFCSTYLGDDSQVAYGFSEELRRTPIDLGGTSTPEKHASALTFIVPPSERTIARGHWLADALEAAAGIPVTVLAPNWKEYWEALSDPDAGDLLWCGITVDEDTARHWVRYNLFGSWLPLPPKFAATRQLVWALDCPDDALVRAERELVSDGWVIPLYHHRQTYLVRQNLTGLQIEPGDWPIPGVLHTQGLRWE